MSSSSNSFLRGQRKSDLLGLAETVGLTNTDGLKKSDLEVALDEFLAEKHSQFSNHPVAQPYYQARARAIGSPAKRDPPGDSAKPSRRRTAKPAERINTSTTEDDSVLSLVSATPGRALALARNVPLPATPADVARVVDEGTVAIRDRVTTFYEDLGVKEVAYNTRDSLSTITSIILTISAFELYYLRSEVLSNRYAFTIPAIRALGTQDHAVEVPDMFLLLTSSFWGPTLLWALTSIIVPAFFGFYFNLGAAHARSGRGQRVQAPDYAVDPLMFSVAKAVITYVVYQQGVTFGGWISPLAVARINSALYGGWKGVITGAVISGIASFYDAVLKR
ncbi:hypothetical protein VPNG_06884 [Cytospora leucostoma]|uniref:Uncharacterized protein n=1 Tax=Cytospora leucostoma TaxID=1230097 RepID=A0A423WXA9_9PEZI|nr:hypothetical protein VPNG_06884 [Cytospora leucostoma]